MAPALLPDDWCLVVNPRSWRRGGVVLVEHPGRPGYEMVKRLVAVPGDVVEGRELGADEFWVVGERPEASTDSRHFGPVSRKALMGRVLLIYGPRERRRMLYVPGPRRSPASMRTSNRFSGGARGQLHPGS